MADTAATNERVAARYCLLNEVGRGGMAVVYRAHDEQLDRDVALKFVDAGIASDQDFSAALIREARAAAALAQPHVVTIYDVGQHDGRPYIVMELVGGGDLRSLLRARGRLSATEAATIGQGVARGLGAIHARGLVHCDVKPLNVLLTKDGSPKLTDFGIARAAVATGVLSENEIVGSAPYLSPEQVKGESIDPRTDVYALGIVLYELLAGSPPFKGGSLAQVAAQRLYTRPKPIGELVGGVPPPLAAIIERALALDPADRFRNGLEMAEALAPLARVADEGGELLNSRQAEGGVDVHRQATRVVSAVSGTRGQTRLRPRIAASSAALARLLGLLAGGERPTWLPRVGLVRAPLLIAAVLVIALAAVRFTVSGHSGPVDNVAVPPLAGMKFGDAVQQLEAAGLQVSKGDEPITLDTPRDVVVTQDPPAGEAFRKGTQVRLIVSQGIALPNLVGQHWDDVKPWMDQNGWRLGRARFVVADQKDFGKVLAQEPNPESGPVADKGGTPINLTIAGPPEATRTGFPRQSSPGPEASPPTPPAPQAEPARSEPPGKPKRRGRDDDD